MSVNYANRSHWSFFPPITELNPRNNFRELNIVRGSATVKDLILHFLLLRKGEHPLYPELGFDDYLFKPIQDVGQNAICENIRTTLVSLSKRFGWGLADVTVYPAPLYDESGLTTFYININLVYQNTTAKDTLRVDYKAISRLE